MPSIFTDWNISEALVNVKAHIPFIVDEFSALLNGRIILTDYFPQYQKLLSYFMFPYFKLLGTGTLSFTIGMGLLSLAGLLCVYCTFQHIVKQKLLSLLLFLAFLGSCVVPSNARPDTLFYMFNYYPMAPVRYCAPWVVGLLLTAYLRAPSAKKLWTLSVACALFALNNPDFGVPVMAGALAALCLGQNGRLFAPIGKLKESCFVFAIAAVGIVSLFAVATRILGGQWPRFGEMFMYQKIFATTGFMLLPMPESGLHWLIYFTFMAGVGVAVCEAFFRREETEDGPYGRLLLFACITGSGIGMYYVGRSHHFVLPAVFPAWFMALALLLLKSANSMRHGDSAEHRLLLLPLWLAAFHLIILATPLFSFPSIGSQVRRLAAGSGEFAESYEVIVELTRRYTVPGEKVGIVTMYAHNIAISAGVDNVYPFAHRGS
ncbi:MAG TPA: hypothetical protein PLL10_09275, partial [Elusimicrobiales bacterium]|nr:hypothetical protein [Elusimicrobiales bacterium]